MPPVYLTPKRSTTMSDGMALCPSPPQRRDCHVMPMGPMNVPALNLCDVTELGFFLDDAPPNIGNSDEAVSSFVPIEQSSSVSDPILKIRPRPSRAFAASTVHRRPAHCNMNVGITPTPIDDDEEEKVPVKTVAAAMTPTKTKTRSMMSYKLVMRSSKRPKAKEVRSTVNDENAAAAATTRRPSCSTPAA